MLRPPRRSTLFPYTTLFRSVGPLDEHRSQLGQALGGLVADVGEGLLCPFILLNHRGTLLRSEEHTSELQSRENLVCRLLLEKKKNKNVKYRTRTHTCLECPD